MKYRSIISFFLIGFFVASSCFANEKEASHKAQVVIPEVALLALQFEGTSALDLIGNAPDIAGDQVNLKSTNSSKVWLNYSSVVTKNQKRKVTATIVGGVPEGVILRLNAMESTGQGRGEMGSSNGKVALSNNPTDIISGIGSCYTGKGIQNGYLLSYEVEIDSDQLYQNNQSKEATLSVVYTLTDDN